MLVNLMPPVQNDVEWRLREPDIVSIPPTSNQGKLTIHPRYRSWLAKCGLRTAADLIDLPGTIVAGHPDRHVRRVEIRSGHLTRTLYLKREHSVGLRVRLKNALAGFGFVSRSEREAIVLDRLETAGFSAPHWIAYGEDGSGRAFLLLDELSNHRELRELLADESVFHAQRRKLAEQLGATLARLHDAGFETPDLAAKHIHFPVGSPIPTILDWQSSRSNSSHSALAGLAALAHLNASLADHLATPRERFRAARAYFKNQKPTPNKIAPLIRAILARTVKFLHRSSIRTQRQTSTQSHDQRLVWLADETVCVIPRLVPEWPTPVRSSPFYCNDVQDRPAVERLTHALGKRTTGTLIRYHSFDPLGRIVATLRCRPWRSPAARMARILFHLQNAGVEVPQLFAFGQELSSVSQARSFLYVESLEHLPTLNDWFRSGQNQNATAIDSAAFQFGQILRRIHDAGCRMGNSSDSLRVRPNRSQFQIVVDPTHQGSLNRDLRSSDRVDEIIQILRQHDALNRDLRSEFLRGYGDRIMARTVTKRMGSA